MKIKPIWMPLSETPWVVGQKVKVLKSEGLENVYVKGKIFTLKLYEDRVVLPGYWNGYSAELELVEEKGQLEFDF